MTYYSRKATRIPGFDYASVNSYFLTICTYERECIFGGPGKLNVFGQIAREHILQLSTRHKHIYVEKFVVMPNHIHMILVKEKENSLSIPTLISLYKAGVTREIRSHRPGMKVWQRSFHDHIIRDLHGYEKIWLYIENNPLKWEEDCFYCKSQSAERQGGMNPSPTE